MGRSNKVGKKMNLFLTVASLVQVASSLAVGEFDLTDETQRKLLLDEFGLTNRVDEVNHTALDCSLAASYNDSPFVPTTVEYYYGVESIPEGEEFLEDLDKTIFGSISLWCHDDTINVGNVEIGGVRKLRTDNIPWRKLSILSTASSPSDSDFGEVCKYELEDPANDCMVVKGGLSLVARETDNLDFTVAAIRDTIQYNMLTDAYISSDIPSVVKLTYLGDSADAVLNGGGFGVFGAPPPAAGGGAGASSLNTIVPIAVAAALIALFIILFLARRRKNVTRGALYLGEDDYDTRLVGTGDPPGSFHHGLFHYMESGQGYLSTRCAGCYDTRQQGFGILPIIDEGDEEASVLSSADFNNLGKRHRRMDVHDCSSGTCKLCMENRASDTLFMPSNKSNSGITQFDSNGKAVPSALTPYGRRSSRRSSSSNSLYIEESESEV